MEEYERKSKSKRITQIMQINSIIHERKRRTNNTIVEENLEDSDSTKIIKQKNKTKKKEVNGRNNKKSFTLNIANNIHSSNSLSGPIKNILVSNAESIIKNDNINKNANKLIIKKVDSSKDLEKGNSAYLKEFKEKSSIISVNIQKKEIYLNFRKKNHQDKKIQELMEIFRPCISKIIIIIRLFIQERRMLMDFMK